MKIPDDYVPRTSAVRARWNERITEQSVNEKVNLIATVEEYATRLNELLGLLTEFEFGQRVRAGEIVRGFEGERRFFYLPDRPDVPSIPAD